MLTALLDDGSQAAVQAGCDFVVAQGTEAGGHIRGTWRAAITVKLPDDWLLSSARAWRWMRSPLSGSRLVRTAIVLRRPMLPPGLVGVPGPGGGCWIKATGYGLLSAGVCACQRERRLRRPCCRPARPRWAVRSMPAAAAMSEAATRMAPVGQAGVPELDAGCHDAGSDDGPHPERDGDRYQGVAPGDGERPGRRPG